MRHCGELTSPDSNLPRWLKRPVLAGLASQAAHPGRQDPGRAATISQIQKVAEVGQQKAKVLFACFKICLPVYPGNPSLL